MKELTLKFEDKTVTINTHEIEGQTLYKLNDILKQYNPNKLRNPYELTKYLSEAQNDFYRFQNIKGGKYAGSYMNQKGVIWFASKLSFEFEMAVIEAFEAAANGDGSRAVDIATSKVITPELLDKLQFWTPLLHKEITMWSNRNKKGKFGYTQIYNHIINKCVANIYTKELKKSHDVKSMKDYLIKQNNVEGLGAYIAMCEMLVPLLQANADYDFLKKLFIETPALYKAA
ncbi:hypothetical protein [Vibrio cholerae]|uniref:hypothetical protein n=1 Tax=Vibrio cholerae TaxID=666 RepID=UPI00158216DE|nr:hypothetical protein [Vibrio cholerae]QKU57457.1 hypothetical protein HPY04_15425 [Vibrio cholerae]